MSVTSAIPIKDGCFKENYKELWDRAMSPNAEPIDINTLGIWFSKYGDMYWNGEYYDASAEGEPSGTRKIYPVYQTSFENDEAEIFCYALK